MRETEARWMDMERDMGEERGRQDAGACMYTHPFVRACVNVCTPQRRRNAETFPPSSLFFSPSYFPLFFGLQCPTDNPPNFVHVIINKNCDSTIVIKCQRDANGFVRGRRNGVSRYCRYCGDCRYCRHLVAAVVASVQGHTGRRAQP